ncbi:MAG: hypothetical protein WCG25_06125 [bacterium]
MGQYENHIRTDLISFLSNLFEDNLVIKTDPKDQNISQRIKMKIDMNCVI